MTDDKERLELATRTIEAIADGTRCRLNDRGIVIQIDNHAAALLARALDELAPTEAADT